MKRLQITLSLWVILAFLSACVSSKQRSDTAAWEYESKPMARMLGESTDQSKKTNIQDRADAEEVKKVVYNGSLSLAVDMPDSTNNALERIAKKYNGYVTQLSTTKSIIRVKHFNLKIAMSDIESLGKVQSKYLSGKDVTSDYLDFQIRLENAEKARNRYLILLEKAENVEAALLVEKELERLNGTIDMLKGQMSRIDHLAEFSTITVYIKERKKPGILGYIGLGLYHSVKWLFVRN